jgi:hypothetical protein
VPNDSQPALARAGDVEGDAPAGDGMSQIVHSVFELSRLMHLAWMPDLFLFLEELANF